MFNNKIAYIVPYFGKLPNYFQCWLESCKHNSTIDWLIFTDDTTNYIYPANVRVNYTSFDEIKELINRKIDCKTQLLAPYKLCDFRVAYGVIFEDYLLEYGFWGYCDVDLIFGNIRKFITDDILKEYDMIGFQGHSTLFRNDRMVNERFKLPLTTEKGIHEAIFIDQKNCYFDEHGIIDIYKKYGFSYFKEVVFANINPMYYNFQLTHMDKDGKLLNQHRIFTWENGTLLSHSVLNGRIYDTEFMYVHFLRRPMEVAKDCDPTTNNYLIIPNQIKPLAEMVDESDIIRYSKNRMWKYWVRIVKTKWRKITPRNIYIFFKVRFTSRNI